MEGEVGGDGLEGGGVVAEDFFVDCGAVAWFHEDGVGLEVGDDQGAAVWVGECDLVDYEAVFVADEDFAG